MKKYKQRVGRCIGYYDSKTGRDLKIVKSVDISNECPTKNNGAVLLDFAQATEGIMVNITQCNPGKNYGTSSGIFLKNLQDLLTSEMTRSFCMFASHFGLTPERLANIVRREAPPIDKKKLIRDFRAYIKVRDNMFGRCLKEAGLTMVDILTIYRG